MIGTMKKLYKAPETQVILFDGDALCQTLKISGGEGKGTDLARDNDFNDEGGVWEDDEY